MQEQAALRLGNREWGMLLALSLLWGGSFFFNAVALTALPALTIVWLRVAIAALVLLLLLKRLGLALPREGRVWRALFIMGLINNVIPFTLIVWGQKEIASGLAAALNATTPLFGVILAHFLTRDEPMTPARGIGVAIGFAGAAVMIGPAALSGIGGNVPAQLACLGGAISYAFAGIYGRRFRAMGVPALVTATGQVSASAVMLLPLVLAIDAPWRLPMPPWPAIGAIAGVAVASTALAYFLYFRILETAGATSLLLVTLLIPVSAILLGVAVLGETLLARQLAGMAMIAAGLAAIDGRLLKAFAPAGASR